MKLDFLQTSTGWPEIATARKWAEENYKDYIFKRETVRDWRKQYRQIYVIYIRYITVEKTIFFGGPGRPSMVSPALLEEIKTIFQNLRRAGCGIS